MLTPVILLSGFLGSGKTTLLLELMKELHARELKPAVLMNELGKADVDGRILSESTPDFPLEKLFDGCICCSKKSEISGALQSLLALAPDVIVVELTGVANPEEVVDAMAEPELLNKMRLHKIVTVLDAEHALEYNSIFSSDRQLVRTLRRQLEVADVIVINKTDLVSPVQLTKVNRMIQKHNERAVLHPSVHAKFDLEGVIRGLDPLHQQAQRSRMLKVVSKGYPLAAIGGSGLPEGREQASFSRIQSIVVPLSAQVPLSLHQLEKLLRSQGGRILRAKGYVSLDSSPEATLIQYAGRRIQRERSGYTGPHYLVIIGYEMDETALLEEWQTSINPNPQNAPQEI